MFILTCLAAGILHLHRLQRVKELNLEIKTSAAKPGRKSKLDSTTEAVRSQKPRLPLKF